jgi:mitotic-spindle organizing protein 1
MPTNADAARTLDLVHDISEILDCGLDREQLAVLVALIERGVNPEALAAVVRELRRESANVRGTTTTTTSTGT